MRIGEMKESKFLKKEDVGQGRLFTIVKIERRNVAMDDQPEELKWVMSFKEVEKGFVTNWTNLQLIAKALGSEEVETWSGKQIVLYDDPNVSFGGKLTGGIRCRAPKNTQSGNVQPQSGNDPKPFDDEIPFNAAPI